MLVSVGDRWPRTGDLVVAHQGSLRPFVGVVRFLAKDKYGDKKNVYITWQGDGPVSYNPKYGYCALNIHNLRSTYKIFRDGVEIK
tara:strand:- start:1946 stop:2200 length:255 start_codon:yes stop_codon:yes gene_type:complete